jgi:hypothetical protein
MPLLLGLPSLDRPGVPDAILAATNLTGAVTAIQDDPASPDATFLTPTDPALPVDLRVSFYPTPSTGRQFQAWVARSGSGVDPVAVMELWEAGVLVRELSRTTITAPAGQLITGTFVTADLTDPANSNVECRIYVPGVTAPGTWTDTWSDAW